MDIDFDAMSDEEYEAFERSTLMAPDDMAEIIQDVCMFVRGDIVEKNLVVPRYGLLSLKARRTPMYCYGHPELKKRFPKSFNDGLHIFISDDYMRTLVKEEDAHMGEREGLIPLVLHHLSHMMLNHHQRFSQFPEEIVALATDISVYAKLKLAYPDMKWVSSLEKDFAASSLPVQALKQYAASAEESIMRELMKGYQKALKEQEDGAEEEVSGAPNDAKQKSSSQKQSKSSQSASKEKSNRSDVADASESGQEAASKSTQTASQSGAPTSGDPAQEQQEESDPLDPAALEQMIKEQGLAPQDPQDLQEHALNLAENAQLLKELGLTQTLKNLEIPDEQEVEKIKEKEAQTRLDDLEDIEKSIRIEAQLGTAGKGGDLSSAAHEEAMKKAQGKLDWKMALQQTVGASLNYGYSEEEPGSLYFIEPKDMGLNNEIYIGTDLPMKSQGVVLVLIDSSGSVSEEMMSSFLSEIFGLIRSESSASSNASEVVMLFADEVIQGKPTIITENNVEEILEDKKIKIFGRGGTDIAGSLRAVKKIEDFKEKKLEAIVYFTDLGDTPPRQSDTIEGVPLVFVCPPETYDENFARSVSKFAKVYPIEEELEVDLTRETIGERAELPLRRKRGLR